MSVQIPTLFQMKAEGHKIVMVTAYDATMARLVDMAGVDVILVGDSLGMVVQGHSNTLSVTLEQMIYHTSMVTRESSRPLCIADLPFGSFQVSIERGVEAGVRLIKEGRAQSVKLEGATPRVIAIISELTSHGVPVTGHLGLIPQSVHSLGGFKKQGRDHASAERILEQARALEEAGVHALVLESIPDQLAKTITDQLSIPTIGIGAGPHCDGQVLVLNDLLGMDERFCPSFVKTYANLSETVQKAVSTYADEVRQGLYPTTKS